MACSDKKNPLQRNGIARSERLLPGLQKDYVNIDEKTIADWIVFGKEFARYLVYYETNGTTGGDWAPFFSQDVSAILGTIAIQNVDAYKRAVKQRFDFLKEDEHVTKLPLVEKNLNDLFSLLLSFAESLDELHVALPKDVALKAGIENLVSVSLAPALNRLLRYYKGAKQLGFLQTGDFAELAILGVPVRDAQLIVQGNGLSALWWQQPKAPNPPFGTWQDYFNSIGADKSIYGNAALDTYFEGLYVASADYTLAHWLEYRKIDHAANHNLFAGIFDVFLKGYGKLIKDSDKELLLSLTERNTHPAHYALFLAFLRLYQSVKDEINTLTQRHLDFYYKEILQLGQKKAEPNSVHLIAELAKPVDYYILAADTLFKAGKDSVGKEVQYGLDKETTFNKATVASLRSVYLGTAKDNITIGPIVNQGRLFASPISNSEDGLGADLLSPSKEWHPIASRSYFEGEVTDIKMPLAEIGFAVASHYLYLQEGVRKVMLRLATSNNGDFAGKNYQLFLSIQKGWFQVDSTVSVVENNSLGGTQACVEFSFTLSGDAPAISNYNPKVHGGTLNVQVPVLKVILANTETAAYQYTALRDITISQVQVAVEVGMANSNWNQQGLKQLLISTDAGPVDPSKPFQPFGGQPRKGATLAIGNKELFTKKNASIKLNIEWGGISDFSPGNIDFDSVGDYYPYTKLGFLQGGTWTVANSAFSIFNSNNAQVQLFGSSAQVLPASSIVPFDEEYLPYGSASTKGFFRVELDGVFGHKEYLDAKSIYLINKANNVTPNPEPKEPYTPVIQSIYISYSAESEVVNLTSSSSTEYKLKQASFFHLYPFGEAEQHKYLFPLEVTLYALPQFRHTFDGTQVLHEGEFYIGFEHLGPQQSVNVLFQVMEGTADPTITKPEDHITWSYLANNQWKGFQKQEVSDATAQLIQSGIIRFIVPADATTNNSMFPSGYLWIKASVKEYTDAICKLLSIQAQAAVATFEDHENAADFLNMALPAGTISKLKIPQSAIKKIAQPYPSFGGRTSESSEAFYTRVSERLRHKARAITIWDYEHLILEAFPLIHKVKCLNHTKCEEAEYNEVLPGHVSIITIPDLRQRNDANPLRPYTNQSTLKAIEAFLKKRISCHVQLHVVNPVFEEIQMKFKLKLAKGFDDFTIYCKQLQEEITAFLSPWAYGKDDINFGGKMYKSVMINFIEERPYVDYITDVEMFHITEKNQLIKTDQDEITASTARSILVSVPASKHDIKEIEIQPTSEQAECDYIQNSTH